MSREALLALALELVDEHGIDALTVRALAGRVHIAPMSFYTHFSSKEQLLDALSTEIAQRLCPDGGHIRWQAELAWLCRQVRRSLVQHPHWLALFTHRPSCIELPVRERFLAMMIADGFTRRSACQALQDAVLMSLGFSMVELGFRDSARHSTLACSGQPLRQRTDTSVPLMCEDLNEHFARVVEFSIAGIDGNRAEPLTK